MKNQAKTLRAFLSSLGVTITHSQALEAVARMHGFKDWNTASASTAPEHRQQRDVLWTLLDDIDTASDMFKGDYEGLAKYVYRKQQLRHQVCAGADVRTREAQKFLCTIELGRSEPDGLKNGP
jgi:hypothetical protein